MLFKIFLLTFIFGNGFAFDWKLSDVKRGADNPMYDFQLSNLLKMLIKQKQMKQSVVISKKIKNKSVYQLRKLLKQIKLGTVDQNVEPYQKKIQQKQNRRFNSYRRFHARNWSLESRLWIVPWTIDFIVHFTIQWLLIILLFSWNKIDAIYLKFCFPFACNIGIELTLNLSSSAQVETWTREHWNFCQEMNYDKYRKCDLVETSCMLKQCKLYYMHDNKSGIKRRTLSFKKYFYSNENIHFSAIEFSFSP